jgi:biotin transport system substrate-specific component
MTVRAADITLLTHVAPTAIDRRVVRASAVLIMTLLTVVAAQISVALPFTPVPFTFQPMLVLVGGAMLGARLGATSQVLYLALGITGLPVFAASPVLPQGALRLLGPTGGYLMAYPIAAFVAGYLAERGCDKRYWTSFAAMAAGLALIFAVGVIWLATFVAPAAGISGAIAAGFTPFIVADVVKLALAAGILPTFWRVVR